MSSSSSTAAVERSPHARVGQPAGSPSRWQTPVTVTLLLAWLGLAMFGIVSLSRPAWLERLGQRGIDAESRTYVRFGDSLMRQHDYRLAAVQYTQSLKIKPNVPAVMVDLAVADIHLGDAQRAGEILRQVEQMELRARLRSTVYVNLTVVAEQQSKTEEAIGWCRRALDGAAEPEKVYRKLGTLYAIAGRFVEARAAVEQALAIQVDVTLPYRKMLARIAEDETVAAELTADVEQQLAAGVRVDELQPYNLDLLREELEHDPEVSRTHGLLAAVCAQLGDHAAANQHLDDALRIWPDNIEARQLRDRLRSVVSR